MKLDLSISFEAKKAQTRLDHLISKGAKIELIEKKKKRTVNQNSYFHALFCIFGMHFGNDLYYVKQVIFKIEVNRELFKRTYVDEDTGEVLTYWRSTADLDTKEMTLAIERFRNYSSQNGLYLLTSEEYLDNYFHIQQEIDNHKQYL